jgi:hypothetical protein
VVTLEVSASRLNAIPLVMKKNGISRPYPTAFSLESKTLTSRPRRAIRVIIPATNPPSRRSSPS